MTRRLTVFRSRLDKKTHRVMKFSNWEDFEARLYELSEIPGYKPKPTDPPFGRSSPLISPAIFAENGTRSNDSVICWGGWAALDVDDCQESDYRTILDRYRQYRFVCYSSASSRPEKPKFRLVFSLSKDVPANKIKHFWFALNTEFGSIGDKQTKDLCRMYYVPAKYPDAYNFIESNPGQDIDPDELMAKHPYAEKTGDAFLDSLPEEMRKEILEHRKSKMTNTGVSWTSYRDCPFVPRRMVQEYSIISGSDGTGRYRMLYRIMTAIACNAVREKYPIRADQIAGLMKELDQQTSRKYDKRPFEKEATRAIEYAYKHVTI